MLTAIRVRQRSYFALLSAFIMVKNWKNCITALKATVPMQQSHLSTLALPAQVHCQHAEPRQKLIQDQDPKGTTKHVVSVFNSMLI